jgi:diguanylate cyclase (GGDEF)-like protein
MHKLHLFLVTAAGVLVLLLLLFALTFQLQYRGGTNVAKDDFISGWTDSSGEMISLKTIFSDKSASKTLTRNIDGDWVEGRSLCLVTHNMTFKVYLDNKLLYDFHPKLGGIYGKRYGEAVHTITIPTFTDVRELRIEADSLCDDGTTGCYEASLEDSREFLKDLARSSGVKFALCIITFIFGLILFLIGIVEDRLCGDMLEAICLGAITMIVSTWVGSQTLIMRILTDNCAMLRTLEYMSLAVLSIPVLMFIAAYTKNLQDIRINTLVFLSAINSVVNLTLVCAGITDYYSLLFITHILIVAGVVLIIHIVATSIIKGRIDRKKSMFLVSALTVLMLSGILDMIMYYVSNTNGTAFLTVIGLIVFVMILAVYEYRHILEIELRSSQAEIMRSLAMKDALTGLGSRTAFVSRENEIMKRDEGICIFVHFDINELKKVNDVYGHAEGDRHIIGAAKVLSESFGSYGNIYRVGGDEFFAVLEESTCREDYNLSISKFTKAVMDYNNTEEPPVPLSIAYGMAVYNCTEHNPEAAECLADSRMYEKKREMKLKQA